MAASPDAEHMTSSVLSTNQTSNALAFLYTEGNGEGAEPHGMEEENGIIWYAWHSTPISICSLLHKISSMGTLSSGLLGFMNVGLVVVNELST